MRVIGTAGHVDHGKSTLIEALTGTHPDRLREEREREMTIVLGFAWMTLPDGNEVGIIDVPGHRDFIENMLSGIGAIDAALFVVASDEGVMPQTREHLAILDLLQIPGGVVALTKIDSVDDPEWLELVEADVRDTLSGTILSSSPLVRVSAKTGEGIAELQQAITQVLAGKPDRPDLGRPRLPVDRVFTMSGFGTIVTGTLTDGCLNVGDEVVILPQELRGRIRGLQTHKRMETTALQGSRTAINISGVNIDRIQRGNVVVHPGTYQGTRRLDVHFRLLPVINSPLRHNTEVKLFIGASEVIGRLRLLGTEILKPGEEGWLQLELTHPIVAIRGDRYILRRPSPGETLGGGVVVDPCPKGRHKRFDKPTLTRLESLVGGTPADIMLQTILAAGVTTVREAEVGSSLKIDLAGQALDELLLTKQVLVLGERSQARRPNALVVALSHWNHIRQRIRVELDTYLEAYPLRLGIPREVLKSKLKLPLKMFNIIIEEIISGNDYSESMIRQNMPGLNPTPVIHKPGSVIEFSPDDQESIDKLLLLFDADSYAPPTIKTCISETNEDIYNALVDTRRLMPVSGEVVFEWEVYLKMVEQVRELLETGGSISVAQVRDCFKTSRRYVLAFLEHLDQIGVTVRDGDVRVLKNKL
jgi:selenocysteine-specific elongation factor